MNEPHYTIDSLEPGKSIGFLVKRCGVAMTRVAERRFLTESVSFTQWLVLANLNRFEHVSATMLSEETGYDMGALTRIVDRLESDGLVRRERCQHDRRAVEIALTTEGRRRLQGGKRIVADLLNELTASYTPRELETLIGLMQRMLLKLQESEAQARAQPAPRAPRQRPTRRPTSRGVR
ncbi:MAG: MarR family winged helix-turn-helix transcriptional regulator [Steroidobacteraceae bacterium]